MMWEAGHGGEVQLPMNVLSWDCSSVRLLRAGCMWLRLMGIIYAAASAAAATMNAEYWGGGGPM